jgi:hypothetical protein
MNPPPAALSKDVNRAHQELRSPGIGSAVTREKLLQRVRAARKRLPQTPGRGLAKTR